MSEDSGVEPYDTDRFDELEQQEDRLFWFRSRNLVIKEAVTPIIATLPLGYRVLEVGCGTGNVLRMLESVCEGGDVVGLEKYEEGVAIARRRVNCHVIQGDVETLDEGEVYQLVGMFDVVEHIEDDLGVLQKLRRHLTAQGRIVLTVPANPSLWSEFDELAHHQRRYTLESLRNVLERAGFRPEYMTHFMAALLPVMKVKRRRKRSDVTLSREEVLSENFQTSALTNQIAFAVTRPEALLVRHRVHIPFGTSILAIAHPE